MSKGTGVKSSVQPIKPPAELSSKSLCEKASKTLNGATGEVSRNGALNQAKRDAGIPRSQQPEAVNRVDMRSAQHESGHAIKDSNGKVISTREYLYTNKDSKKAGRAHILM
ncbi:hypothetical protein ABU162_06625 [Paenibacillus thiaminolyticus]|uniref:hypothetical protein n=1 Tax=Paenibacillus thiaminolyticus TaxID=49283 RepID=UPI0035A58CA4